MEIVSKNSQERGDSRPIVARSTFDDSYAVAGTYRFGEYGVHFVGEAVPNDRLRLHSKHALRSYTLGAPLMQGLRIKKDWFQVPLECILPLNYDKFITNPNIGEDINAELVGTSVVNGAYLLTVLLSSFRNGLVDYAMNNDARDSIYLTRFMQYVLLADMLFSEGSLPAAMGCHLGKDVDLELENFYGRLVSYLSANSQHYLVLRDSNGTLFAIDHEGTNAGELRITLNEALCRMRDGAGWSLSWSTLPPSIGSDYPFVEALIPYFQTAGGQSSADDPLNLARFFAYQIVCAHFYSNDSVDYVYSAELYRQNLRSLIRDLIQNWVNDEPETQFEWNGVKYLYDTCSAYFFERVVGFFPNFALETKAVDLVYDYFRLIFGYNRSLRHVDYFTGARTRPLAVGDVGVSVNNGYVNVVDTIQKTWFAKFLNQVNRTGRRVSEYMRGLFPGLSMARDYHEPIWLGHTEDDILSSEVENTSDAQLSRSVSITSNLEGNASRFAFELDVDRYSIVIGITYFDIQRFYPFIIERPYFHVDRFDMFNPFLQFNGDQVVHLRELDGCASGSTFGYQGRYKEYKERVPQCFGGFNTEALKGWIFRADDGRRGQFRNVSSSYIRSYPSELDAYYLSLSGHSLANYFHFIIVNRNDFSASRPMVANPQLG